MELLSQDQIAALSRLHFSHRHMFPRIAAVYFVFSEQDEVVYVGKTTNLRNRWRQHHRAPQMNPAYRIGWTEIIEEQARNAAEDYYIALFNPPWNNARVHITLPSPRPNTPRPLKNTLRDMRISAAIAEAYSVGDDLVKLRGVIENLVRAAQDDLLADLRGTQEAARVWGVTRIRAARHIARLHELYGIGQLVGGAWVLRQSHIDAHPPDAKYRRKSTWPEGRSCERPSTRPQSLQNCHIHHLT